MFTRILVPLDRSEYAARAVEPALSLAEKYGARITLLMVMFRAPLPDPSRARARFSTSISSNTASSISKRYAPPG